MENLCGGTSFTAKADDWDVFLLFETEDLPHARRIESKIKSQKSLVFIRNLKRYPESKEKLFDETQ